MTYISKITKLVGAPKRPPLPKPALWQRHTKPCAHCDKPTERRHSIYVMPCCLKCERTHYPYITKSRAMKEYRLTEDDLATLDYWERLNPHDSTWTPIRLYLLAEIEALSHRKSGQVIKRPRH